MEIMDMAAVRLQSLVLRDWENVAHRYENYRNFNGEMKMKFELPKNAKPVSAEEFHRGQRRQIEEAREKFGENAWQAQAGVWRQAPASDMPGSHRDHSRDHARSLPAAAQAESVQGCGEQGCIEPCVEKCTEQCKDAAPANDQSLSHTRFRQPFRNFSPLWLTTGNPAFIYEVSEEGKVRAIANVSGSPLSDMQRASYGASWHEPKNIAAHWTPVIAYGQEITRPVMPRRVAVVFQGKALVALEENGGYRLPGGLFCVDDRTPHSTDDLSCHVVDYFDDQRFIDEHVA